eukprot:CAMPEP_0181113878 /NCGR_PEP_ID=MMETSP1071-20121207/20582_1 /TAXON_ID=35127 /ORGANISM="Thalassiosira sp., Strain NH16" /LENGTH=123 /DNA_ID=CAMNT_0023197945 /DNA_START=77 /DNA_END=445 /DNA_ORIENTATION=-
MKIISAVAMLAALAARRAAATTRSGIPVPDPEDVNPLANIGSITASSAALDEAVYDASLRGGRMPRVTGEEDADELIQLQDDSSIAEKIGGLQVQEGEEATSCIRKYCTKMYKLNRKEADGTW